MTNIFHVSMQTCLHTAAAAAAAVDPRAQPKTTCIVRVSFYFLTFVLSNDYIIIIITITIVVAVVVDVRAQYSRDPRTFRYDVRRLRCDKKKKKNYILLVNRLVHLIGPPRHPG